MIWIWDFAFKSLVWVLDSTTHPAAPEFESPPFFWEQGSHSKVKLMEAPGAKFQSQAPGKLQDFCISSQEFWVWRNQFVNICRNSCLHPWKGSQPCFPILARTIHNLSGQGEDWAQTWIPGFVVLISKLNYTKLLKKSILTDLQWEQILRNELNEQENFIFCPQLGLNWICLSWQSLCLGGRENFLWGD